MLNHDEDVGSVSMKKEKQKSDVFGVWIKLKMPRQREEVEVRKDRCGNEDEMSKFMERVCCICEKAFRSGKALGGHMRSHVMKKRREDPTPFDFVEKKNCDSDITKKCSCVICGKKFPSMKSLFGHMRCHPDRDWRGINPPPNLTSPSSSSDDDDDPVRAVDLTASLRGWAVTAKRGRKAMSAAVEDDRLRDAVNFLMKLASAENFEGEVREMGGDGGGKGVGGGESVELKVLKNKRKRKKVKLCDLNLLENEKKSCDSQTNLLDFDLNEVPPSISSC